MVTFTQIFYVQGIWTNDEGNFAGGRLLAEVAGEHADEEKIASKWDLYRDYMIHAYLF